MDRQVLLSIFSLVLTLNTQAQDEWITYLMGRFDPSVNSRITDVNELSGNDSIAYMPQDSSRMRALGLELGIKGGRHLIAASVFGSSEALVGNSSFRYTYSYLPRGSVVAVSDTLDAVIDMLHYRLKYAYGTNTRRTNALFNVFIALDHVVGRLLIVDSTFIAHVNAVNNGRQPGTGFNDLEQFRTDLLGVSFGFNLGFAMFKKEHLQVLATITPSFSINHRIDKLLDGSKHHRGLRSSVGLSIGIGLGGTWKRYRPDN